MAQQTGSECKLYYEVATVPQNDCWIAPSCMTKCSCHIQSHTKAEWIHEYKESKL